MSKNKYLIKDNHAEIIIDSKKYGHIIVLINKEDILKCKHITWHYAKNKDSSYICGKIKGKNIKLHRYILDIKNKEEIVDHINRNTLDNRRRNLRITDHKHNSFNRSIRADNITGVIGVDYRKDLNRWRAKIKYDGVTIHLGYFRNLDDAIINRRIAEEYLFGEYSPNGKLDFNEKIIEYFKDDVIKRINKKVA